MNLIANTGIQFFVIPLEINLNDNFRMYFHEWFDTDDKQLKLEIAHFFPDDDGVWVAKRDIFNPLGLGLTGGKVGRMENGKFKPYSWEEIKSDFFSAGKQPLTPMETDDGGTDCFPMTLNRCSWEKFENRWLPFPFFMLGGDGRSKFAPTNWCRCKLIPDTAKSGNTKKYHLLLAFDTRAKYEKEGFEEEDLMETPVFASDFDPSKDFALCDHELLLVDFCSKSRKCEWVDEYILDFYHSTKLNHSTKLKKVRSIDEVQCRKPKMSYLAQYIYIIRYIQQLNVLPVITLFSDKNAVFGDVDLMVDMGNSRTCAVLFDKHDFAKVERLGLQNFSNPFENGRLNRRDDFFDMRLAFREANFGVDTLHSSQFVFPSMVRLGTEANELIHKSINLNTGVEKITTFSSPKRYLWDNKPQRKDWEFVTMEGEKNRLVQIRGISEQLNSDGSLNTTGGGGIDKYYSRKALMTFGMLEILAQAKMQINSYDFRHRWGEENKPRRIDRIIVTCPTAMSRTEQIALRKCAEDASIILDCFYAGSYFQEIDEKETRKSVQVVPSVKNLLNTEERSEWIYDEATCAQFVYLFAELTKRYRNNCKEYFDFYGKVRKDLEDYKKKSLTVGSVDIGAGTTDVMIAAYKYDDAGQCVLTPVPLFWESFYIAGDDLLKNLIRELVIEGDYAVIQKQLKKLGKSDTARLILDFFAPNNARQDVQHRQLRSEFNLQVSVPAVSRFLELLNENKVEKETLTFDGIFADNKPTDRVLEHFEKHFGFSAKGLQWNYDKEIVSKIVANTFDKLAGKISTVLSYYGCDIVLLSGRPASLKPLSDLFLKYYAVSPNRLIRLNDYRIGTWYPFQDGKGYFRDTKSIVAVGATIGNYASTRGGLSGFSLNLSELIEKMLPTTEYFTKAENDEPFITPEMNNAVIDVSQFPLRIWTRQLNSPSYPTRLFYMLDFNEDEIKKRMKSRLGLGDEDKGLIEDAKVAELERIRKLAPFKFEIVRESYMEDKESLKIESVANRSGDDFSAYFSLQVQSMSESESYWLDSGEFTNLSINH
jgi:hypothetical protein